ncbi:unnamed protein product, partial [marine sediment metagenome]
MAIHIKTLVQLQAIQEDLDADYILDNDIDATATKDWNGGAGFVPIAGVGLLGEIDPFGGSFDGQEYTITGLYMRRDHYFIGLFGLIGEGAEVKNVTLKDADIAFVAQPYYIGGLAGANKGVITNCHSIGDVAGYYFTGCLVGRNEEEGTITHCHSEGTVSGAHLDTGGLVGSNKGTIMECYSTADVTSTSEQAGGFVGNNYAGGIIQNCYARGNATATDRVVGGFVGVNWGNITNCYSTGIPASEGAYVGGFVGRNKLACIGCFWDIETSGEDESACGTGKSTVAMKTKSTFTDAG